MDSIHGFDAKQARAIASKQDSLDYVVQCILRRVKMAAEKGGFEFTMTIKWGDFFDANDALYLKMGFDDGLELQYDLLCKFIFELKDFPILKNSLENLGFKVDLMSWQSGYEAGVQSIRISW